ncbi:class I SAM-dependent methyltransferase [Pseudoxanthomonas japonensis]|nr:class I SAM-dependent methyltransferase [Pseudoxanthomonas japonensis]
MASENSAGPPQERERLAHAVLDEPSRILKAMKIVDLLGRERFLQAKRILEIGCGSGVIASTLSKLGNPDLEVQAVDVRDNRIVFDGYGFTLVDGTTLPFDSNTFDIVISNHVIEHVGERNAQLHHLLEISRVMTESGCVYLAVPNKWRLIEPHYRLPLLSWLPLGVADAYLRIAGKADHYDCIPLSAGGAERLFGDAGLRFQDLTLDAVYATLRIEFADSRLARALGRTPRAVARLSAPVISTLIYKLESTAA